MKGARTVYAPVPYYDHVPGSVLVGVRPFRYTTDENMRRMLAATAERDDAWHTLAVCAQEPVRWWRINMLNVRMTLDVKGDAYR